MQGGDDVRAALIGIDFDVVVIGGIGRPETHNAAGLEPLFIEDAFEHRLRIGKQATRGLPDDLVVQDRRVLAGQFPGSKERRPVDMLGQVVQIVRAEGFYAQERRRNRWLGGKIDAEAIGSRLSQRRPRLRIALAIGLAHTGVIDLGLFDKTVAFGLTEQVRHHPDGTRGIEHVDDLVIGIAGLDLDRRVSLRRRRATDEQRDVEALTLHFARHEDHFVE